MTAVLVPLAHVGHWAASVAFFAPVVVLPLVLWLFTLRHRDPREPSA